MTDEQPVDFGTHLRLAREKRGMTLQQIAATTKISARVLASLERNDISILPGGIFSRAFVRSYAREIGLDPDATVEMFVESFPTESAPEAAPTAAPEDFVEFESGRKVATTLLQLLGLSVVVVVAVLIYFNFRGSSKAATPPESPRPAATPARTTEPSPPPVIPPAGDAVAQPSTDLNVTPPLDSTTTVPSNTAPANAAAAPGTAQPAGTDSAAPTTPSSTAPLRVTLTTKSPCWVSMTVDGTRTVARIVQPGERLSFESHGEVVLNVGDAGAVSLTINEAPAKPLGAPGAVVTTRITTDNYRSLLGRQ